eukprot:gene26272-biopygen15429
MRHLTGSRNVKRDQSTHIKQREARDRLRLQLDSGREHPPCDMSITVAP